MGVKPAGISSEQIIEEPKKINDSPTVVPQEKVA
jgi:hypothetical protein